MGGQKFNCCVPSCHNHSSDSRRTFFFVTYPSGITTQKTRSLREDIWCQILHIDRENIKKTTKICDIHFKSQDFKGFGRMQLKENAVPSLYLENAAPVAVEEPETLVPLKNIADNPMLKSLQDPVSSNITTTTNTNTNTDTEKMNPQPPQILLQHQPQAQLQQKSTTSPSKICRYLVQLDRENNSAFFTIRQEQQSPADKNRMEDIFTLLKSQEMIRQDCHCFGALLSLSNENKEAQDIFKGGTQLICQDEKDPSQTLVVVVKNLELMKTELQTLAKSQKSNNTTTINNNTIVLLNNNSNDNNQQQGIQSAAVVSENEKVLQQRQLLQLVKKRRQAELDNNSSSTIINNSALSVSSPTQVQAQPQKVYLLRTNNNIATNTTNTNQLNQIQAPISLAGSTTKFIRLGSSGNFIALPSLSSNQSNPVSKILVPSQKSLCAQVQTGEININPIITTTPTIINNNNNQHLNEPTTSYFITQPEAILPTTTNNSSNQNDSEISNMYIFSPQACYNNSNVLKGWESRLKQEKNISMPHGNWFSNLTSTTIIATQNLNEKTLNIYELETNCTSCCLEISRSIQMTENGKLTVCINSQVCTDCFMKPEERTQDRFCTFENVLELIRNVNNHQLCRGCDGFEHVSLCQDGVCHGSKWFSIQCPKVVPITEQQCIKCQELEATLKA